MAEANSTPLNEAELEQIHSILQPLSKNPEISEELNPMLSVFRQKMGYGTQTLSHDEEEESEESSRVSEEVDYESPEPESLKRPPTKVFEDDDIDLDELLAEPKKAAATDDFPIEEESPISPVDAGDPFADFGMDSEPAPTELKEQDPFSDFGLSEETSAVPPSDDFSFGEESPAPTTVSDPFAGLDEMTAPSSDDPFADLTDTSPVESDPFGGTDFGSVNDDFGSSSTPEADPFADMDTFTSIPESAGDSSDPFVGMDGLETPSEGDEFDLSGTAPTSTDGGDELMPPSPSGAGDDDFFSSPADSGPSSTESDPFADFGDLGPPTGQDPFSNLASSATVSEDPFADFVPSIEEDTLSDISGDSSFESFSPDLESDAGEEVFDSGSSFGLEADLQGLANEEKQDIDKGLKDEELAIIQKEILRYPPTLRRAVIDSIVQDRLTPRDQKGLLELIKIESSPQEIADFLSGALGETIFVSQKMSGFSKDGVPIISTDPVYTKEGLQRQRKVIRRTIISIAATIFLVVGGTLFYRNFIIPNQAAQYYEQGLMLIREAGVYPKNSETRKKKFFEAEESFARGENILPNHLKYLNLYGVEYTRVEEYDRAFEKLFGKVSPDFGAGREEPSSNAWDKREKVPIITLAKGQVWDNTKLSGKNGSENRMILIAQDGIQRKIMKAGAYIVMRLEKQTHDNPTYKNLGRFHSSIMPSFTEPFLGGGKYKNDQLAINFFKQVYTDGNEPYDEESTAGIAKIYYNRREFGKAASFYNKIVEIDPSSSVGQGGLLSTYIEMWKEDGNPQFVINHHRQIKNNLNIEKELSLHVLSKLASFYTDLNKKELRIRYNINPTDQVSGMEVNDNALEILNLIYHKTEKDPVTGTEIEGSQYAEGYYQRGRYFASIKESIQARRFFEKAAALDPAHYLASTELAENAIRLANFAEADKLLNESLKRFENYKQSYGAREEDETLIQGNIGRIYFDKARIQYLSAAGIHEKDKITEFPGRKIYPFRARTAMDASAKTRSMELKNSLDGFSKAESVQTDEKEFTLIRRWRTPLPLEIQRELRYFKGWVDYMNGDFAASLNEWVGFEDEDEYNHSTLLMGKANAFFYTGQYKASLGNYLKVQDNMEERLLNMGLPKSDDPYHQEVYQTLVAAYNNIGAVYEKQGNTAEALKHYWKAIETARKINEISEIAMSNKDLIFKKEAIGQDPLLEDWLSPTLDSVKKLARE
ncbi:tetratricopeptide repeat protein [Leptospira borgpetersenii]|nr:tetratricopeptide repeat protein [Leptospira borgpetersenii]EKP12021.1 tetratricopeptide repeat protein [Leptospira borgpetersenii str. 200801926]EMN14530.1 tetratricopeptide repeat protein [Leptospira borgpetersenii str. Brem 307]EMN18783.1 tetratricopeptide repeat protein [Leptospira borgpetersenii str. Brem 328]ENO61992.1 tetratricopeptide repeat protein [Leptospira borgpetersenii serovar Mini str. 201000851]